VRCDRLIRALGIVPLAFFLLPLCVQAQSQSSYFAAADLDHDKRLSLVEFQEWMSYAFHRMDANHNDVLEPEEQHVTRATRLTLAELHTRQAEQFRRQDKNGDGYLSQKEFLAPPG